jgi:hypothetical protein
VRAKSKILDQFGRPAAFDFLQAGRYGGKYNDSGPRWQLNAAKDTNELVSATAWRRTMSLGRVMFANFDIIRGALIEQANLSLPLIPQYTGSDREWGRQYGEPWLYEWHKINNVRGPSYSQDYTNRVTLIETKVDGDHFIHLTASETGYPMLQSIRAHRIGDRNGGSTIRLESGPYRGLWMTNGVIHNEYGRPLAYNLLGETEQDDEPISARDMVQCMRPDYADQMRGLSHLAASAIRFSSVDVLREFEMRAHQLSASIALIEHNETGTADEAAAAVEIPTDDNPGTASGLVTQTHEAGMVKYYKSGSGDLTGFTYDRPGMNAQNFEKSILRGALYGIEWDADFALALQQPAGAWARTIIEKIRRSIINNQTMLANVQRISDGYGIAKAIKRGEIPAPSDGDWYSWEFQGPPRITADTGNEERVKREKYLIGALTLKAWEGEQGNWWEETREQREIEVNDLLERASRLAEKWDISMDAAVALIEQRSPNPPLMDDSEDETETAEPTTAAEDDTEDDTED